LTPKRINGASGFHKGKHSGRIPSSPLSHPGGTPVGRATAVTDFSAEVLRVIAGGFLIPQLRHNENYLPYG